MEEDSKPEEKLTEENDKNTKIEDEITRQRTSVSMQVKPNYDYLVDIKQRYFYFDTNKPVKYVFWILLGVSIVSLIVISILLKNVYIVLIFAFVFIIILSILSVLRYGIRIELNIEEEQIDLKRKSIIPIFNFLNKHYSLMEIKSFELVCDTINPECIDFRLNLLFLKDNLEENIFHRWGYAKEKEKFQIITKNLNAFITDGVQEVKSNRASRATMSNNENMIDNKNVENFPNKSEITLIFFLQTDQDNNKECSLTCSLNEIFENVIKKYRTENNDDCLTENFLYNAKNLDPSLTVEENGLIDNSRIMVLNTE